MEPDFSGIFHQSSKDLLKGHPYIPEDSRDWPEEWLTTFYKTYPRMPHVPLQSEPPSADFFELISRRSSKRDFKKIPVGFTELSTLLKYSCGITGKLDAGTFRRAQASGGARFPIEVYPFLFQSNGALSSGVYHYNVKDHALDVLLERHFSDTDIHSLFTYPWVKNASAALILTAVFWRTQNKYGERGYRYILLEAGHIAQNVYLVAEALGLKCCALAGTRDEKIEELLDIDGVTESLVYTLILGK
ncbi:MAG: SagB/ThcOx family dehydrogenase [Candidatus Portnoybacteria bacterium]|nr:SagB/ThcOx family dehydrogenase [Candidatus Portnoybacteria bacterium]